MSQSRRRSAHRLPKPPPWPGPGFPTPAKWSAKFVKAREACRALLINAVTSGKDPRIAQAFLRIVALANGATVAEAKNEVMDYAALLIHDEHSDPPASRLLFEVARALCATGDANRAREVADVLSSIGQLALSLHVRAIAARAPDDRAHFAAEAQNAYRAAGRETPSDLAILFRVASRDAAESEGRGAEDDDPLKHLGPDARLMVVAHAHPEWSVTKIAAAAGVNRTAAYKHPMYRRFLDERREQKAGLARQIGRGDGRVDVVDAADGERIQRRRKRHSR